MIDKKTILFVPTLKYLSNHLFESFAHKLKQKYRCVYFDPGLHNFQTADKDSQIKVDTNIFDDVFFCDRQEKIVNNLWRDLINFYSHARKIKKYIDQINPSVVITPSDSSFFIKVLDRFYPGIEVVII